MGVDIAILISTFERPEHLRRCLLSLEHQRGVDGRFEVVVTDDGSRDHTLKMIAELARRVAFPLTFTTHDHDGFRLSRCRNEGVAASSAPYLLFTDGDCLLPPDHVKTHLDQRRIGRVNAGDCVRLDREASLGLRDGDIAAWSLDRLVPREERHRMTWKAARARVYPALRLPMRPRLTGNNIALWRSDFERINGFDERFVGWGLEDRDLQRRLTAIGVRSRSVMHLTTPVHVWHEPAPSFSRNNTGTDNLRYYERSDVPAFCVDGLTKTWERQVPATLPMPGVAVRVAPRRDRRAAA